MNIDNARIAEFSRRLHDNPAAATQVTVSARDAQAVLDAAEIAVATPAILAVIGRGGGELSPGAFWQQMFLALIRDGNEEATIKGCALRATAAVAEYLTRYGEKPQAVASAMPECPKVAEPVASQPKPMTEDDVEIARQRLGRIAEAGPITPFDSEPTAAVEPQAERKGLEWETIRPGIWQAGQHIIVLVAEAGVAKYAAHLGRGPTRILSTFAEAQARCQDQEDKMLAQQAAEQEGRGDD